MSVLAGEVSAWKSRKKWLKQKGTNFRCPYIKVSAKKELTSSRVKRGVVSGRFGYQSKLPPQYPSCLTPHLPLGSPSKWDLDHCKASLAHQCTISDVNLQMNMTSDMTSQRVTSVDDGTEKAAEDWVDRIQRIPLKMRPETKIKAHL